MVYPCLPFRALLAACGLLVLTEAEALVVCAHPGDDINTLLNANYQLTGNLELRFETGVYQVGSIEVAFPPGLEGPLVLIAGADDNRIGESSPSSTSALSYANRVQYSGGAGVGVATASGSGNLIRRNLLFGNGRVQSAALDLDLGAAGPDANDGGDGDSGPNLMQNFPTIASANVSSFQAGATVQVAGSLSTAAGNFTVDIYAGNACRDGVRGAQEVRLGSLRVVSNGTFVASWNRTLTLPAGLGASWHVSATATDSAGNTPESGTCTALVLQPVNLYANGFE